MASTASLSLPLHRPIPTSTALLRVRSSISAVPKQAPPSSGGRRDCLLLLTATTALTALSTPSANAQDIPLFGLRRKLQEVEQQTEELVKEGFEAAEKGVESAEKGIEAAEKGIEAAEKGIEAAEKAAAEAEKEIETAAGSVGLGAPAQAGLVAAAEVVGVVVASSVVNGILRPDPRK